MRYTLAVIATLLLLADCAHAPPPAPAPAPQAPIPAPPPPAQPPPPKPAPASHPSPAPAPDASAAPPSDPAAYCRTLAQRRANDARTLGQDAAVQQRVFDSTLAECTGTPRP